MRSLALLPLLLVACETTPSSGSPLSPVEVTKEPVAEAEEGGVDPEVSDDPRFAMYDGLVELSSEELSGEATPATAGSSEEAGEEAGAEGSQDALADVGSDGAATSTDPVQPAQGGAGTVQSGAPAMSGAGMAGSHGFAAAGFGSTGWPLRLVATTPEAQPPRAILGLPDGQELVVRPGAMVPELGVVVMSVGQGTVEVARIVPAGDHALVQSQTLTAQF